MICMTPLYPIGIFILRFVCAGILFSGGLFISCFLIDRFFSIEKTGLKWCAVVVLWLWMSTFLFHALIGTGWFRLEIAVPVVLAAVAWVRLSGFCFKEFADHIVRDARGLKRILFSKPGVFFLAFIIPILLTVLRTLYLQPLGWDFFTYHGVKAGMWVQTGSNSLMHAPGGWSLSRNYFGGGEIFTAWAMLPFHSDLLVGFVDALMWMLLGMVLLVLGSELGLGLSLNFAAVLYCLTLPALWLSIGSGYVEPVLNLTLMLGFLFVFRFIQRKDNSSLFLGMLSLGTAAGIKITACPILCWAVIFLFGFIVFMEKNKSNNLLWFFCGLAAALSMIGPWILWNIVDSGFPLAGMPVKIFGIELGRANEMLSWYQNRPELLWKSYHCSEEWWALLKVFRWPYQSSPHVDRLTLIPAFLCMIAIIRMYKNRQALAFFASGWIACVVVSYFHPQFSVVRLIWAPVNGRFLLPALLPVVMISSLALKERKLLYRSSVFFFLAVVSIRAVALTFSGWVHFEIEAMALVCACLILMAGLNLIFKKMRIVRTIAPALLLFSALLSIQSFRDRYRYASLSQSTILHDFRRYWIPAAEKTDDPPHPFRIAVTSAPSQNGVNWFSYSFLGSRLQNRLFYIPIARDGQIIPFGPGDLLKKMSCYDTWYSQIRSSQIDYVISFTPASIEMGWMEGKPNLFDRIDGDGANWGLYQIRK